MKIKKLDELQYIKRGNIFKHCFFTIIALLLIYIFMSENGVVITSERNALIMIVLFTVSLFCIEMILYGIYPLSEKRQRFVYIFAGLVGLGCLIFCIVDMIDTKTGFIESQMLTDDGIGIIISGFLLAMPMTYILKTVCNKLKGDV